MSIEQDKIFSPGADPEKVIQQLKSLTTETKSSHTVHDFSLQTWGKAILSMTPYQDAPFAKLFLHSPQNIKAGDMLITSSHGLKTASMVFDVKKSSNPDDLYELHAVKANPTIGIGHDVREASRSR